MRGLVLVEGTKYPLRPSDIALQMLDGVPQNMLIDWVRDDPEWKWRHLIACHLIMLCQKHDSWGPFEEKRLVDEISVASEILFRFVECFTDGVASPHPNGPKRYFLHHDFVVKCFEMSPNLGSTRLGLMPFADIKMGLNVQSPFTGRKGKVDWVKPSDIPGHPDDREDAWIGVAWDCAAGEDKRSDNARDAFDNVIVIEETQSGNQPARE